MSKRTDISSPQLPDPRDTDLVMKASYERQTELLRTTVNNLSAVSQEQEICNNLLKKETTALTASQELNRARTMTAELRLITVQSNGKINNFKAIAKQLAARQPLAF